MQPVAAPAAQPPPVRRPAFPPWMAAAAVGIVICIAGFILLRPNGHGSAFQYYGQWIGKDAPDFALTDQDGKTLRLSDLHGDLILMTFGFTHCPNICPTTLANLAAICQSLPAADQQRLRVLFITVDPARDSTKALGQYVRFYDPSFTGLTGSADQIAQVAKDYGAYYESVPQQSQIAGDYYTINHSAYVYLIDPQGHYAVLYDNSKLTDHASMSRDIEHLLGSAG